MDRNLTISNTPITTCTQTTHHIHSAKELRQLRIALRRAGRRGRQEFTCPMIRAWRRQFVDTYAVDATFTPSDASQSDKTELHRSRVLEADIQVGNVLVRWHCDGWPVATPRTAGETNLDGDALQPAPTPAPNDPNCFGYAHRIAAAGLPPIRLHIIKEEDHLRSDRGCANQRDAGRSGRPELSPSFLKRLRSARRFVAFDATSVRDAPTPGTPRQSNSNPGWCAKEPSPAFRHAQREIEFTIMTRNDSEPAPRLLDFDGPR